MTEHILYHGLCLAVLLLTYVGSKGTKSKLTVSFGAVYIMTALIILSDCIWGILSSIEYKKSFLLYLVNIIYYIAEILGVYAWMIFSLKSLKSSIYSNKKYIILVSLPAVIASVLTLITPFTSLFFSIENGEYIRGRLFFIDVVIKLGYLLFSSVYAFSCSQKESRKYMKKQNILLMVYCIPVIIAGILQSVFYIDFNCVAPVLSLAIVYKFGISNEAKDNGDLVKAIANAFSAAFIINTDDHTVRTVSADDDYSEIEFLTNTMSYEKCINTIIRKNVMPEDRINVEKGFAINNILNHLNNKKTYSLIYKVKSLNGAEIKNKATFMKAFSGEDRHEIFLGIESLDTQQIFLQGKEDFESEREEFEKVKESFTNVIANIIEARDMDSGEHVLRVKSYTHYLCNQVMEDCPEYGLTPLIVRYIINGSALHDIGKIMIPDSILLKTDKLTDEEFEIMKTHCEKGCTILDKLPKDLDREYTKYAKEICRWHHEKYDGNGYPDGLIGDQIPISAQIVSLADCFDALTTKRVYKYALSKEEALQMIIDGKCGSFNSKLIECLKKTCDIM